MNAVVLGTVHKVKGLEKPIVFGVGIADGILPHWRSCPEGAFVMLDELPTAYSGTVSDERCVIFVLVSRAQKCLYLTAPMEYRGKQMLPSRFLEEMHLVNTATG
ncbi:ATP-dependent DNA helicase PcrA [subsurface metagenome]